jgi:hypothetical protein
MAIALCACAWASGASGDVVRLDAAQRELAAIVAAPLAAGADAGEVTAFGRVLDPTPLLDLALARSTTASTAERTRRERARVQRLSRGQDNASVRELEAAEDADLRARLDAEAARARLASAWGDAIADMPDLDALLTRIAKRRVALARIDVPAAVEVSGNPAAIAVATATQPPAPLSARILGPLPSVDPVLQGAAWLVLIESEPPPFGSALTAKIALPGRSMEGVVVPRSAVVRRGGAAFVYVEKAEGEYEPRRVELSRPQEPGWLVGDSLRPGERVVVAGAQALVAAEGAAGDAYEAH